MVIEQQIGEGGFALAIGDPGTALHKAEVGTSGEKGLNFYCCAEEDCRRRRTPESVRFLGRRVYAGLVVGP